VNTSLDPKDYLIEVWKNPHGWGWLSKANNLDSSDDVIAQWSYCEYGAIGPLPFRALTAEGARKKAKKALDGVIASRKKDLDRQYYPGDKN
jgi:hypothetical protein